MQARDELTPSIVQKTNGNSYVDADGNLRGFEAPVFEQEEELAEVA